MSGEVIAARYPPALVTARPHEVHATVAAATRTGLATAARLTRLRGVRYRRHDGATRWVACAVTGI